MENSKDEDGNSILASAIASKNAAVFDAVMTIVGQDLTLEEVGKHQWGLHGDVVIQEYR